MSKSPRRAPRFVPRTLLETARTHVRTLVPVGVTVVAGLVVLGVLLGGYAKLVGAFAYEQLLQALSSFESMTVAVALLMLPLLLLSITAVAVWAGVVTLAANSAVDSRRSSMPSAALRAVRRSPRVVAVVALVGLAVLGAFLATPVLVVAGILGLVLRRALPERRRPQLGTLVAMAIPFGLAARTLVRWSLVVPAVVLDGEKVRGALAVSSRRVVGHAIAVAVVLAVTALVAFGAGEGAAALAASLGGAIEVDIVVRLLGLLLVGGLPLVAAVVLFRAGEGRRDAALPKPATRRARIAAATIASLIVPFVVTAAPLAASAAPATVITLTAEASTSVSGEPIDLTATFAPGTAPTALVTFFARPVGAPEVELGFNAVTAGSATITATNIPVGTVALVAVYPGDASLGAGESAPVSHTVAKASVTVDVTPGGPAPVNGGTMSLEFLVKPIAPASGVPTGNATVTWPGGSRVVSVPPSGVGELHNIPISAGGLLTYTVTYDGDSKFNSAVGTVDVGVGGRATEVLLGGASSQSYRYGDDQIHFGVVRPLVGSSVPTGDVELMVNGAWRATATLVNGGYTFRIDDIPVGVTLSRPLTVRYLGDVNHAASDSGATAAGIIDLELAPAIESFDVHTEPGDFTVGDTVEVVAELPLLGDGPIGQVTFSSGGSTLGTPSFVNGVARLELPVTQTSRFISIDFAGDGNFAATSTLYELRADRGPVTVDIDDLPTGLRYGDVFTLSATVTVGGGAFTPTAPVNFVLEPYTTIATAVPNAGGVASVQVCAGSATVCPTGVPRIRMSPGSIVARYPDTSVSAAGESEALSYAPDGALTTTTLTSPSSLVVGSAVPLSAQVVPVSAGGTPTGTVSFYAVDGTTESFLTWGTLSGGVATATTTVSDGGLDLRWPATAIIARYNPLGDAYEGSPSAANPVTITRIGVTVDIQTVVVPIVAGDPVTITVELTQAGGTSAPFRGDVTITADDGDSCTVAPTHGTRIASCEIEFASHGAHTVEATFEGDVIYAPGTVATENVTVGAATPVLGARLPGSVIVDTDVTVAWNHFDTSATGTVEVYADGTKQCEVPLSDEGCTVRFGAASATGGPIPVIVRYLGDGTFPGVQDDLTTYVTGCATLDVRSLQPSLGTVTVNTAPNCGVGGYLAGTAVTVTATPGPDVEFLYWQRESGGTYVPTTTSLTTTFTVTSNFETWLHVASFRAHCFALDADMTGNGGLLVFPASNCSTPSNEPGYAPGTVLAIYPDGRENPSFGEVDAFYGWGAGLTPAAEQTRDSSNRPYLTLTITGDTVIPVTFGPRCRPVDVIVDPGGAGDESSVVTPQNCTSPLGDGFLRYSQVEVTATPAGSRVLAGWAVDGVEDADLGRASRVTIEVGQAARTRVTALTVECFRLDLAVEGGTDLRFRELGSVAADVAPNCPDGSPRYLAGTKVVVTPSVLIDGVTFTGWEDGDGLDRVYRPPVGPVVKAARTIVLTADTRLVAGFFVEDSCSRLLILGDLDALDFGATGCGPGFYYDFQKIQGQRLGEPQWQQWQQSDRTQLVATVNPAEKLDVYVSVRGDTRYCFGNPSATGPTEDRSTWKVSGPLTRPSDDCYIGGDIAVRVEACQTVTTSAQFTLPGGGTVGPNELPGVLYLPGADGLIAAYSMEGFNWSNAYGVRVAANGARTLEEQAPGPCKDAGNAFPADTSIAAYAAGPATGFVFQGWQQEGGVIKQQPLFTATTNTARTLPITATYKINCHDVSFGEGIRIIGEAPYCPGSAPEDNSFIAGTAIHVTAAQNVDGRILLGFTSGVSGNQIYEDPDTKELTGFVYVDGPKSVQGDYPTKNESFGRGVAQGLKFGVGLFAVAAPIFVGLLFPPAGILLAFIGMGAGIANLVGDDEIASGFELMNPAGIAACAARWAFTNAESATGGQSPGGALSTLNTIYKFGMDSDVFTAPVGVLGGGAGIANFAYGLYSAGIADTDLSPQTIEQLRGTATMTNCLDQQWRAVGSDVG
jgi:hypothetical protein